MGNAQEELSKRNLEATEQRTTEPLLYKQYS